MNKKYIVVHAGRRDDYQLALALKENDLLKFLVTDFYAPIDFNWFQIVSKLLPNVLIKKLAKRYKVGLKSYNVEISYKALYYAFIYNVKKNIKYSLLKDQSLGLKALYLSKKYKCPIISMNTYANYAFKNNKIKPNILFQFHPHPTFVKELLNEEMKINKSSVKSLIKEYEFSLSANELKKLSNEIWLADKVICASSITKKSLLNEGINGNDVKVIPYGVDTSKFVYQKRNEQISGKFKVIFIGSLNQRKGITYLLDALSQLKNIELTIIGRGIFDLDLIKGFNFDIKTYNDISFEELLEHLHNSHCFVLPSLIEGFGQVILEAMATGVPVITSKNTIGNDIINHGVNGFVVPIRDSKAIANAIIKLQNDNLLINEIGKAGHDLVKTYTWERFRDNISQFIKGIN